MIFTKKTSLTSALDNIQAFLDNTRGQITIGEIPPIRRAALAAQGKTARVALVAQDAETIAQLLQRLDTALGKAMAEDTVIDEVLPEIKRRRTK
jgi:enterochelin esterase-like enzyme